MKTFSPRLNGVLSDTGAGGGGGDGGQGQQPPPSGSQQTPPGGGQQQPPAGGGGQAKAFYDGLYDGTGKIDKAAWDRLPDTDPLKPFAETFKKYDTVPALLGAFGHSVSLNGKKGLMKLPANATPEAKAEFSARLREILGVPDKPEGYGIKKPEGVPDALWNNDYVAGVLAIAHKHNIPPEAMQELVKFDNEFAVKADAKSRGDSQVAFQTELTKLKTEWGAQFEQNIGLVDRLLRSMGVDPETPGIHRNFAVIRVLAQAARVVGEDHLVQGDSDPQKGMSDEQKALDIVNNPANPLHKAYWNDQDPQNRAAVTAVENFNKAALAAKKAGRAA